MSEYQSMCQSSCSHNSCKTPCQCPRFCMGLCPFYPPPKPPKPPTPPTPPTPTPSDYVFGAAQFQLQSNAALTVLPDAQIPFDTTLYNSGKFVLNVLSGAITLTDAGVYRVDYQFNINTVDVSAGVEPIKISIALNSTPISSVDNVTLPQQISGTSIIETTMASSILTIINDCPHTLHTDAVDVQANITITRLK